MPELNLSELNALIRHRTKVQSLPLILWHLALAGVWIGTMVYWPMYNWIFVGMGSIACYAVIVPHLTSLIGYGLLPKEDLQALARMKAHSEPEWDEIGKMLLKHGRLPLMSLKKFRDEVTVRRKRELLLQDSLVTELVSTVSP